MTLVTLIIKKAPIRVIQNGRTKSLEENIFRKDNSLTKDRITDVETMIYAGKKG